MIDAMDPHSPWIRAHGIGFSYGRIEILRDVSFDLHPGRHYIVAGPNGAGKSTLLDVLANLKRPHTGHVSIHRRRTSEYTPAQLARIMAFSPQEFQLDFSFTVREIVAMGRRPYFDRWGRLSGEDERIVGQAMRDMRIENISEKAVTALSGGEKRRCMVARALAQTTPILLLDEPNSGLDIAQALSMMALARAIADGGGLVVTVSHDLNLAARFGHELIFLKNGRLETMGTVEEVFTGEILSRLYETEASVRRDEFIGAPVVSFGTPPMEGHPGSVSGGA